MSRASVSGASRRRSTAPTHSRSPKYGRKSVGPGIDITAARRARRSLAPLHVLAELQPELEEPVRPASPSEDPLLLIGISKRSESVRRSTSLEENTETDQRFHDQVGVEHYDYEDFGGHDSGSSVIGDEDAEHDKVNTPTKSRSGSCLPSKPPGLEEISPVSGQIENVNADRRDEMEPQAQKMNEDDFIEPHVETGPEQDTYLPEWVLERAQALKEQNDKSVTMAAPVVEAVPPTQSSSPASLYPAYPQFRTYSPAQPENWQRFEFSGFGEGACDSSSPIKMETTAMAPTPQPLAVEHDVDRTPVSSRLATTPYPHIGLGLASPVRAITTMSPSLGYALSPLVLEYSQPLAAAGDETPTRKRTPLSKRRISTPHAKVVLSSSPERPNDSVENEEDDTRETRGPGEAGRAFNGLGDRTVDYTLNTSLETPARVSLSKQRVVTPHHAMVPSSPPANDAAEVTEERAAASVAGTNSSPEHVAESSRDSSPSLQLMETTDTYLLDVAVPTELHDLRAQSQENGVDATITKEDEMDEEEADRTLMEEADSREKKMRDVSKLLEAEGLSLIGQDTIELEEDNEQDESVEDEAHGDEVELEIAHELEDLQREAEEAGSSSTIHSLPLLAKESDKEGETEQGACSIVSATPQCQADTDDVVASQVSIPKETEIALAPMPKPTIEDDYTKVPVTISSQDPRAAAMAAAILAKVCLS